VPEGFLPITALLSSGLYGLVVFISTSIMPKMNDTQEGRLAIFVAIALGSIAGAMFLCTLFVSMLVGMMFSAPEVPTVTIIMLLVDGLFCFFTGITDALAVLILTVVINIAIVFAETYLFEYRWRKKYSNSK
jgi:hypothetical protein